MEFDINADLTELNSFSRVSEEVALLNEKLEFLYEQVTRLNTIVEDLIEYEVEVDFEDEEDD